MFNPTIARITARALIGRRRFLLLLPLPLLMVGLAILGQSFGSPENWADAVIVALGFGVVLPVIALIVGTGVLGSEIDDGTIAHILAKPLSRREIILTKVTVAVAITWVTTAVPMAVVGLVARDGALALGLVVGSLVGSLAYSALFAALSLLTRRPVIIGLLYVLIWEGLLSNLLSGTRVLSIQQYVKTVAARVADSDLLTPEVSLALALGMAFVFTVGGILVAIERLNSFSVVGETS